MTNKTRIHKVPTILDAFKLSIYLNPKIHQNNCPKNKYIPHIKTYYTICDNGSRKIPKYYLNGVAVNALGLPLSKHDKREIKKKECKGCYKKKCIGLKYYTPSTTQTKHLKPNRNYIFPYPNKYFTGPLTTI